MVITGCDSGLGFSLAHWCHKRGLVVIAACHTGHSEAGATSLEEAGASTGRLIVVRGFDVASEESIRVLGARVQEVVRVTGARVHALINNAGVLVLARLEWQTPAMIRAQIQVGRCLILRNDRCLYFRLTWPGPFSSCRSCSRCCGIRPGPGSSTSPAPAPRPGCP